MKSLAVSYTEELLKQQKYLANWLPNNPIKLGDIGEFQDNCFVIKANLQDFQIDFEKDEGLPATDINYSSQGGVTISMKLNGKLLPAAQALGDTDAGFVIEFAREKAIVVKTMNTKINKIKNQIALEEKLLQLHKNNVLKKKRGVITEVVYADSATILISNSKSAKIELKATAALGKTVGLDIADASFQFSVPFKKDLAAEYITRNALIIFYRIMAVIDPLLNKPRVVSKSGYRGEADKLRIEEVGFDFKPLKQE